MILEPSIDLWLLLTTKIAKTERAYLGRGVHLGKNYCYNCNKTRKYGYIGVFLAPKASIELCTLSVFEKNQKDFKGIFEKMRKMKEISKQSKQFQKNHKFLRRFQKNQKWIRKFKETDKKLKEFS